MASLSRFERSVLDAIARQTVNATDDLMSQIARARVVRRENTGAGFYTSLEVAAEATRAEVGSPVGHVGAQVSRLAHGMGFLLWMHDGFARALEGYSYGEDTSAIDFEHVDFVGVGPRVSQ
jgi:hypothetical protein